MTQPSDSVVAKVLGRRQSMFAPDIENHRDGIADQLNGSRVLVIGAGGSIGAAFTRAVCQFSMTKLHLIDISENSLVEVVRDLRSEGSKLPNDFATFAIDFGHSDFQRFLQSNQYDYVMNFAALKHVRSERDPYTLMRLLQVNVLATRKLIEGISSTPPKRFFAVSSDKAVNSANLMGASKAFMERIMLSSSNTLEVSSARFANVAFSCGSLLDGFLQRIDKGQPISAPLDVRRYFISHREAAELCLLGCFSIDNGSIIVPKLDPRHDMVSFANIARTVLESRGYGVLACSSEEEARRRGREKISLGEEWPCYFSQSNTAGEKSFEEFYSENEILDRDQFINAAVVTRPIASPAKNIDDAFTRIDQLRCKGRWTIDDLSKAVQLVVPDMKYVCGEKNLDQKM